MSKLNGATSGAKIELNRQNHTLRSSGAVVLGLTVGGKTYDIGRLDAPFQWSLSSGFHVQALDAVLLGLAWVLTGGEDHALVATFPRRAVLPEGWTAIGAVRSGPRRAGVFMDGRPTADLVQAVGAEGAGHVHFG